jgi:hypothetical protein
MCRIVIRRSGAIDDRPYKVKNGLSIIALCLILSSFIISCASQPEQSTQTITAYSTSTAQAWMEELFACADELSITVNVTAEMPEIYLRIGEPGMLLSPAYQIGEEDVLIVTHRESSVQNLSLEEVQALFSGLDDASAQVWVYPSGLDVQGLFDQFVMQGRSVVSSARVAANPQQMSDLLNAESDAVGILPRRWKAGNVREVYSMGVFPVLAVLRDEPQAAVRSLVACLQSD